MGASVQELQEQLRRLKEREAERERLSKEKQKLQSLRREVFSAKYGRYVKPVGRVASGVKSGFIKLSQAAAEAERRKQSQSRKSSPKRRSRQNIVYAQNPYGGYYPQPQYVQPAPQPKRKKKKSTRKSKSSSWGLGPTMSDNLPF